MAALRERLAGSSPEDLLTSVTDSTIAAVSAVTSALDAEMIVAELLGYAKRTDRASASAAGVTDDDRAASTALSHGLVAAAEQQANPGALGLLRAMVCALHGEPAQPAARAAAERLHAAGVHGAPWTQLVGRPTFVEAFRYGDVFGRQDSISVAFEYAHRHHTVNVLIDHDLGGGVKDAWVATGKQSTTLRDRIRGEMSTVDVAEFEDLGAHDAYRRLAAALTHPPCPEQSDQIEDTDNYLPLLRSRVAHLGTVAAC